MSPRYIAYYRVSTSGQGRSGLGLEAQRQAVHAFIGAPPDHEFTEVESGKRSDRPELRKALDLAELTNSVLVVAKLDRLSRDVEFLSRLQKAPIKIIFADMPFADSFMIGIMAQVAQWEREQISKRTKAALKVARERGKAVGGDRGNLAEVSAAGRKISAQRRSSTAQARAAKVFPHIRQANSEGFRSLKSLAGYLNRRGIRTSRGNPWSTSSVRRLMASARQGMTALGGKRTLLRRTPAVTCVARVGMCLGRFAVHPEITAERRTAMDRVGG